MIIGGVTSGKQVVNSAWFFDIQAETWRAAPSMLSTRRAHACGVIRDSVTGESLIVVAGGQSSKSYSSKLDSTEIFSVNQGKWIHGPTMSQAMTSMRMAVSSDSKAAILIGGLNSNIGITQIQTKLYKLTCSKLVCQILQMSQTMASQRSFFIALLLSNSLTSCS